MAKTASRVLRTGGLQFNGKDAYVEVPNSSSLMLSNEATVIAWVKMNPANNHGWIMGYGVSEPAYGFIRYYGRIYYAFRTKPSGATYQAGTTWLFEDTWYHIAATFKRNNRMRLYVNSLLIRDDAAPNEYLYSADVIHSFKIASSPYGTYLKGLVDTVLIYNRALSADEIYEIYSKGTLIKDGLVLYLDFSEGEGNIAYDKSGYGNHGYLYGNPMWVVKKALRVLPKAR